MSQTTITPTVVPPRNPFRELHIHIEHTSKIYRDDTRRFSISFRSVNQYLMIEYHCDTNATLVVPLKSRKDSHLLL